MQNVKSEQKKTQKRLEITGFFPLLTLSLCNEHMI